MRVLLALVFLLVVPASALAHVTILPETSRPGQTGEFRFRVQNERTDAATIKLEIFIPDGVPVEAEPVKGYDDHPDRRRHPVVAASRSRRGAREDFKVRLGPLPDQPRLVFKALQYYADGQVVRWIQDPTEDAERPAAVLDLGGARAVDGVGTRTIDNGGPPWFWIIAGGLVAFFAGIWFFLLRA